MKINPELKGILAILLIALIVGILLAGTSGKLEQWGLPWFTGAKAFDKIVFVSDRSGSNQVYIMNLDGSNQKQLTRDIKVMSAPTVTMAANRIAFVGVDDSSTQVFAIGVNGGSPRALTTSSNSKRQPVYGPDGKKLAYIESGRVFVSELSGANPEPVLPTDDELAMAINDPSGGRGAIPMYSMFAWGPDGESLAGITSQNGVQTLVYLPSHDGEAQRFSLGNPRAKVVGMCWAKDEPLLVATIQVGEASAIFNSQAMVVVFAPDQEQPQAIFSSKGISIGRPAISPDGSAVAFPVRRTYVANYYNGTIAKLDLQTGKQSTVCKGMFRDPVFSPNGDSILASQIHPNGGGKPRTSIVTIDPDTGEVTTLATKGKSNINAVWTPQSQ